MKFLLLNKNDADLKNRIDQINLILSEHKPHFLLLNELQKHRYDTISENQFPGYKLEYDNLDKNDGWSRSGILVKNGMNYKRRRDLETAGTSTIWLQIGCAGSKHFLLQNIYRQFRRLNKPDTNSQKAQQSRWDSILEKWTKASSEQREILTMGDLNMDSLQWEKQWNEIPDYEKPKQNFYKKLRDKILINGTYKINSEYTRVDSQPGGRQACLDHIYSTNPEKINSHHTHHNTFSDHAMLELNKKCKNIKNTKKFIKIRSMKNFDKQKYCENLQNHPDYIEILHERDTDVIVEKLTRMIQDSLRQIAPVIQNPTIK